MIAAEPSGLCSPALQQTSLSKNPRAALCHASGKPGKPHGVPAEDGNVAPSMFTYCLLADQYDRKSRPVELVSPSRRPPDSTAEWL